MFTNEVAAVPQKAREKTEREDLEKGEELLLLKCSKDLKTMAQKREEEYIQTITVAYENRKFCNGDADANLTMVRYPIPISAAPGTPYRAIGPTGEIEQLTVPQDNEEKDGLQLPSFVIVVEEQKEEKEV